MLLKWIRATGRFILFTGLTSFYILCFWVTSPFRPDPFRNGVYWRRRWLNHVPRWMGIRVSFEGEAPEGPVLFVSNHRSYLDPAVTLMYFDARPLSKAEVLKWPLIGHAARITGALFVQREVDKSRKVARETMRHALSVGQSILNYPEGTTSDQPHTLAFKPGAFQIAAELGVPIVPVVIEYADNADAWIGEDTFLRHFFQTFAKPVIRIAVSIGDPMVSNDAITLMNSARRWMDARLEALQNRIEKTST